jgi:hypothetical protein
MGATESINVRITYNAGAYVTQTVRGQRASSTGGARFAAQALAHKLFPGHGCAVRELPAKGLKPGQSLWRIDPR